MMPVLLPGRQSPTCLGPVCVPPPGGQEIADPCTSPPPPMHAIKPSDSLHTPAVHIGKSDIESGSRSSNVLCLPVHWLHQSASVALQCAVPDSLSPSPLSPSPLAVVPAKPPVRTCQSGREPGGREGQGKEEGQEGGREG